jgi:predicted nucleic acid-binding protein
MKGNVVGLDTSPLIYFFEKNTIYHPLVRPFFVALSRGEMTAVTSTITLVETLVYPIRNNRHELARRYQDLLLNTTNLSTFDVSSAIAQKAAAIRASYQFRTPDAIQLAAALEGSATFFLTNDHNLKKFSEIQVITVNELA